MSSVVKELRLAASEELTYATRMPHATSLVRGYATEEGTARYHHRQHCCHPGHVRDLHGLRVSSIGLGTYLGDPNAQTDERYASAIDAALQRSCNVLDTAINYRCQRSERVIGETLERLIHEHRIARDELVLCTKGGYLPFDAEFPADPQRYVLETFLEPGILPYDEFAAGCHCLHPRYLDHQLETSLKNLRLETIDVYYLHNPEQQLEEISRDQLMSRMEAAFAWLERKVRERAVRLSGTATWNGYRANPEARDYLSLHELVKLARRVGGERHHFRVIQLPFNLTMPEAYAFPNQAVDGQWMSLLEAAGRLGVSVVTSASLLQSRLAKLPASMARFIPALETDAQRALQFARSTPGIITALVGMQRAGHVEENLKLANLPPLSSEQVAQLFTKTKTSHAAAP
ncbi:MAG: aldo/keto reductase [Candidatus Omnitrophica bacterium]|nr:aldo/keto reductase [Candidatus Omnitrophota bacterium]